MRLSFGMIFSIILIIVFLSFGFYVIMKFLDFKGSVEAGTIIKNIQNDVDKMWKSSQGSQEKEYRVPTKVEKVCFVDYASDEEGENSVFYEKLKQVYYVNENFFFYPVGSGNGLDAAEIEHLDLGKITQVENPFCIDADDGKISLVIKKNFDESLVTIEE